MNIEDLELVEYTEDMGRVAWPLGFEQVLSGKSIAGQVRHYMVHVMDFIPLSYYLADWAEYAAYRLLQPLDAYYGWEKIIVRKGTVVGFVLNGRTVLPYRVVASDYTSENNGAGYKERTDYYYLVCVPEKLDREPIYTPPFGAPVPELTVPVIPYDGSRGEDPLPEGFGERLDGKPLSVQMYYFAVNDYYPGFKKGWEDEWHKYHEYKIHDLCRGRGNYLPLLNIVEALIVQNDRIVGVRVRLKEGAIGETTADLYPYEIYGYERNNGYSSRPWPDNYQLVCTSLPG